MITIQEHIQLSENLEKVFSVVGNFQFLKEWDPGIKRVEKISQGKLKVGTEFMIYVDFFFKEIPMKYTLIEFTENEKCVYRGETDDISVVDTIEFSEKKEGCVVHYRAEFTLKNSPSFLEPVFEKLLENTANNAFEGMRNAFNQSRIIKEGSLNKYTYKLLLPIVYDFSKMGYHNCKKEFRALSSNLSGKTAIITGATAGIGYESSLFLASRGARLILVGRDENKLNSTKNSIIQNTGNSEIFIERAELTLMNEIKLLADRILENYESIDILINNAGALFNEKELTSEGFEKSFALLLLGPYIFTTLLFPLLKNSENGARIINVSSGGMYGSRLEVQHLNSTDDYNGTIAYSRAKRGLVAISEFWAESLKKDNIASFSMHPGWTDTEAVKSSLPGFYNLTKDILRNTKEGADTINWLASAEELNKKTGGFYLDRKLQPQHIFFTEHSPEEVKNLVDFLENCGEKFLKIS